MSHTGSRRNTTFVTQNLFRDCVLEHLRSLGLNKFVLWGRSMGATSALMYCTEYNPKDVFLQVIDSGFYSFEKIAV